MCWSAVFSFFPLIWTVVAEFAAAIYEAVSRALRTPGCRAFFHVSDRPFLDTNTYTRRF
jgi:hypothetical protein